MVDHSGRWTSTALSTSTTSACSNVAYLLAMTLLVMIPARVSAQLFSTKAQTFEVKVGESVQLPCQFSELDAENKVVVWKRGFDVLAIDDELNINDNRFQIKMDGLSYVLSISTVEPYDSAEYTCSVTSTPPAEITHKLQVNVPASAKLSPSGSTPLLARVGEEVIVKCSGSGNPPPALTWRRKSSWGGHTLPVSTQAATYGRLRFEKVAVQDSGVYECKAANGVGEDAAAEIEIRVEAPAENPTSSEERSMVPTKPWVETDRLYIPATLGAGANISCSYSGQPEPTVDWLFNGFKINSFDSKFKHTAQFATMHNNQSVTIFQIKDIHEDHFGDYTCKVANSLGTVEKTIHLSGKPGPPALLVRDNQFSWTVQSVEPISEYKVHYRLAQEDTWKNHKIFKSDRSNQDGEMWTHSIPLNFLDPNTDYELQLSARNTLGWGSLARNYATYKSSSDSKPESNKMTGVGDASGASVSNGADWLRTVIPLLLLVVVLL